MSNKYNNLNYLMSKNFFPRDTIDSIYYEEDMYIYDRANTYETIQYYVKEYKK